MKMPSRDPRSYVAVEPLPITSQKGLKIQARSATVFNPTYPSRDVVRQDNYKRRLQQMQSQGFRSLSYKPYQGIGDPFYLDEQKLILHSLGQWEERERSEGSSSSEDEGAQTSDAPSPKKTMTAAKFVLRRTRKDLNTLSKEVSSGSLRCEGVDKVCKIYNLLLSWFLRNRDMIRNVRLGHGLFQLIKQQRETKTAAFFAEKRRKEEEARNAWQAPKRDSDTESDESDDELSQDVDLDSYMDPEPHNEDGDDYDMTLTSDPSPDFRGRVLFSGLDYADIGSKPSSAKTVPARRKKNIPPRPYTPQHTNLSTVTDTVPNMSKDALFRQLCVLNWILEAMNLDQGFDMSPISKAWSFLDIGGSRTHNRKKQREKQTETKWEQFVTNTAVPKGAKRSSSQKRALQRRSTHYFGRTASTSMSASPSSSSSQLNVSSGQLQPHGLQDSVIVEESPESLQTEEDDTTYSKSIFRFLDEYYESLKHESRQEDERKESAPGRTEFKTSFSDSPVRVKRESRKSESEGRSSRKSILKTPERPSTAHDVEMTDDRQVQTSQGLRHEKKSSKELRADIHFIRPKTTPQLIEYQSSLPSNKHSAMTNDMRQKFAEILEDKSLTLHDILEQMDRERMLKCSNKLVGLKAQGHSFHRTLRDMRDSSDRILHRPANQAKKDKEKIIKKNWFTNLREGIPWEMREKWYYKAILDKLERFGMVESTSKQSVYKFLKVLEPLRDWELCSPDVSAAIEFCREKIVEMTVEEYEEWFQQQFPKIQRPQTAPPNIKTKKKDETSFTPEVSAGASKVRYVQSAVVRRSQT